MKRKMFAVRADLAEKVSELASRRGTLFDYVNDLLEQTIRADSMGLTLNEALDEMWTFKAAREAGFTIISEKLLYDLIEKAYKRLGKKEMIDLWNESGLWYGRYYEDLDKFENAMKKFFWDISEFKMSKEDENTLSLTCLGSKFSDTYTELFSKFLEGVLNAFGYDLEESELSKGVINLRFKKSKGN